MWAKIFECLKLDSLSLTDCDLYRFGNGFAREDAIKRVAADQVQFHQLNLVCKRFRQVFMEHSELSTELVVPQPNASRLLPSLLLWLRRHSGAALKFAALGGELYQEMTMSCSMMQLSDIYPNGASDFGLLGLSAFKSLTNCNLNSPPSGSLDLQALQGLTSLQKLCLAGGAFNQLFLKAELTYLCLSRAKVTCTAHTTSLQRLFMDTSSLEGLHPQGLPACTSLRSLDMERSVISAGGEEDLFVVGTFRLCIPEGMTCLTQLSSMCINLDCLGKQDDLGWVCGLTSLCRLDVAVRGPIEITQDLTNLVNLTQLQLTCQLQPWDYLCENLVFYFVDWAPMQCLKEVVLSGLRMFDERILQLASLECLELVCLTELHLDEESAEYLAELADDLAQDSDVTFKLDGERVSSQQMPDFTKFVLAAVEESSDDEPQA